MTNLRTTNQNVFTEHLANEQNVHSSKGDANIQRRTYLKITFIYIGKAVGKTTDKNKLHNRTSFYYKYYSLFRLLFHNQ